MKFGKYLKQNVEESLGGGNYLDYERLKGIIKRLTAKVRRRRGEERTQLFCQIYAVEQKGGLTRVTGNEAIDLVDHSSEIYVSLYGIPSTTSFIHRVSKG